MSPEESRWRVAAAFRAAGAAVYEGRARPTTMPDLVIVDPTTGASATVRVQTGKKPRGSGRLYFDQRRVGQHADVLALVDPDTGSVDLRPLKRPRRSTHLGGVPSPAGHVFRTVEGVRA